MHDKTQHTQSQKTNLENISNSTNEEHISLLYKELAQINIKQINNMKDKQGIKSYQHLRKDAPLFIIGEI